MECTNRIDFFFFKQKPAYDMRISDWSSDVCSSDLPGAAGLDPPPIAFTDAARARERSLFALYQVISQGLEGTSMASFEDLPDGDRWALSFYVGSLAFPESSQTSGGQIWDRDAPVRPAIPDLATHVAKTPEQRARALGEDRKGGGKGKSVSVRVDPGRHR